MFSHIVNFAQKEKIFARILYLFPNLCGCLTILTKYAIITLLR